MCLLAVMVVAGSLVGWVWLMEQGCVWIRVKKKRTGSGLLSLAPGRAVSSFARGA